MYQYISTGNSRRNRMGDIDYDEYDYEEAPVKVYYLDNEDEEENEDTNVSIDDDDLMSSLSDARIAKKPAQRNYATNIMKKPKLKVQFAAGEQVMYRKKKGMVLFGPYEKNYKQIYELQMEDGTIVSAIANSVKKA